MYNLHLLGWHSFQQLCLTITRELLGQTVQSFSDSNDAGRDGAFTGNWEPVPGQCFSGKFVIQCKFSSRVGYSLTQSDLADEIEKARKLVINGICDVYVLMTNAKTSGRSDEQIKKQLTNIGVKHVLIYGAEWIEAQIRENTRLRMLVPRVYGLGDLSQILDERAYAQARAVLESLREDLAKVVITDAYRKAVEALDKHGFVLLIGEPAAGKTTIASMLAMAAADKWNSLVLKLDDPEKVVERWNVNEPSQFFWIDDAFGVTQYESSLVHGWNHSLSQVKTMLRRGAKIVMTSRDYIYNHARKELKEGAFPLLEESQVVIDVHELSNLERQQILYNHLKLGKQSKEFLSEIKPYLEDMAAHNRFIPEIARRIADPFFTKNLYLNKYSLWLFVEKREQFLCDVINGLDADSKAALGLIYMRKDCLDIPISLQGSESQALERFGSTLGKCIMALEALKGSLVTQMQTNDQLVWRFKHPTIGDAYAKILASRSDLLEIFLSGSSTENLLSQVTCGDVDMEKGVIIPKSLFPMMINRLREFSASKRFKVEWMAEWKAREILYRFLARRCSKGFLSLYLKSDSDILNRVSEPSPSLSFNPMVDLIVRLHKTALLPEENRKKFIETVGSYAVDGLDVYALKNDDVRSVFTADEFNELAQGVHDKLLPRLEEIREDAQMNYDSSDAPNEHMEKTIELFDTLKGYFCDDEEVMEIVEQEMMLVEQWIAENEPSEPEQSPCELGNVEPDGGKVGNRSIFDDIDED
jgi:energy-coupling factor transporter ATP-binding protein EcfA2